MARPLSDERDEIRLRTDLVELVGQRVTLKRTGKHFTGLCPFHNDKHPSFTVDPSTGRYKCWSCNESGDVFTWVMKTEGLEFFEAMQLLAERAGIQLKRVGSPSAKDTAPMQTAMREALEFFKQCLKEQAEPREYCLRRGIDQATVDKWEIGFAPANGEALTARLKRAGISLALSKDLFLVDDDGRGGYYDRFRSRLMFPIYDEKNLLVAFGGRLLGDGNPKYINSSDTPLYRKSRVLYGLQLARTHLVTSRSAVLVEGYLDVIACHRSGAETAVASLGTALGEDHCKLLKKRCDVVTILYDSDPAGQKATERAIPLLEAEGLRVRVAKMPDGQDPDTLLREKGAEAVLKAATRGISPTSFKLSQLELRASPDTDRFWEEAVAILGEAKEDLEREGHLLRLAGKYPHIKDVRTALARLTKMVENVRGPQKRPMKGSRGSPVPEFGRVKEPLAPAEMIVFGALHEPKFQKSAWIALRTPELFATGTATELAGSVLSAFPSSPPEGLAVEWISRIEPEEMRQLLSDIHLDFHTSNLTEDEIIDSMNSLKRMAIDRELRKLRLGNLTPQERQEINHRLRLLKPGGKPIGDDDDEDPFA